MQTLDTSRRAVAAILLAGLLPAAAPAAVPSAASDDLSLGDVRRAAGRIDRLVEAGLRAQGVEPNAPVHDETFVRRIHLDLVGRIPTVAEARAFLASTDRNARAALIDDLLTSPGHVSAEFHWWADLLRVKTRLNRQVSGWPFEHWVKTAIAENRPYDEMVREMLTASGPAHERGNGATGYLLRDRGMPEDSMSNTMRVFLGTRLECAQCHDHPFDRWKQREYFEMVAFTGGIEYRLRVEDLPAGERLRDFGRDMRQDGSRELTRTLGRILQPALTGIIGDGTGMTRLPGDYAYDDAQPGDWVAARTILGDDVALALQEPAPAAGRGRRAQQAAERARRRFRPEEADSRTVFADWLTAPDNERFATVMANRMWKRVMGVGLIEPVDDMKDDTAASNPRLMAALTKLLVDLDYDLRAFQRVLYNTQAYQREAVGVDPTGEEPHAFAGPLLRRMTAEEVWDSLLTLVVEDLDATLDPTGADEAEEVYARFEELSDLDDDELQERFDREYLRYTDRERYQALVRAEREEERAARRVQYEEARPVLRRLAKARRSGNREAEGRALAELAERGVDPPGARQRRNLLRASDLPSPAPDGHLLREFGQSDRETIQAGYTDANVPQVLALLNGFVEEHVLSRDTALMETIALESGARDKVRVAFLATLGRSPTPEEETLFAVDLREQGGRSNQGERDLVWVLLNTHEFLFVR